MSDSDKTLRILENAGGWHVEYHVNPEGKPAGNGGIVINNVRHNNYPLASDIRVMGFWIEFKHFTQGEDIPLIKQVYYPLNDQTFKYHKIEELQAAATFSKNVQNQVSYSPELKKGNPTTIFVRDYHKTAQMTGILNDLHQFQKYSYLTGLQTTYELTDDFKVSGNSNVDMKNVHITQTFLFSRYSNNPPHEPSGGLTAARLFPLIKFSFIKKEGFINPLNEYYEVYKIRADYRFEYNMSVFIEPKNYKLDPNANKESDSSSLAELIKNADFTKDLTYIFQNQPQQAGLFADKEEFEPGFGAAEKPIIYEVVGDGLKQEYESSSFANYFLTLVLKEAVKTTASKYWDNIHWWGGYKEYHIISAIGGFHCCHLHWHWPKHVQSKELPVAFSGETQFKSSLVGGELLDPFIPVQDIRFAIVKKDISPKESFSLFDSKTNSNIDYYEYETYFKTKRGKPKKVIEKEGDALVFHISYISYDVQKYPTGTFFIQGLFFAHEYEPDLKSVLKSLKSDDWRSPLNYAAQDDDPAYEHPDKEDVQQKWLRNPEY